MKRLNLWQTNWLYSLQDKLKYRNVLLDLFSITELPECKSKNGTIISITLDKINIIDLNDVDYEFINHDNKLPLAVCHWQGYLVGYTKLDNDKFRLTYLDNYELKYPVLTPFDEIELFAIKVQNYKQTTKTEITTIGRYLTNYFLYIDPFGDKIEYQNKTINLGEVESLVANLYANKSIDLSSYEETETTPHDTFMNNFYFLCGFGDLFIPVFSEKSLQTSPEIPKLKKQLLEQYKDQLNDPVIAAKIEDELIKVDKEWLKDDPSYGFYGSDGKKFNVHRKKQFLTGGVVESFGVEPVEYSFVKNSLSEGWDKKEFPTIFNEIRQGSYNRGIDTAKGGEQTKYLLRIFQNTIITEQDCGTKKGLTFTLTEDLANNFIGRYIIQGNSLILLDENNVKQYINKTVIVRSLMFCTTKPGVCYKCAGKIFEQLNSKAIGIFSIEIGTAFLKSSMKAMHGTKTRSFKIESFKDYLVDVIN